MLSGLDFNDDTQVAQAAQQALGELLFVSFDEIPAAQVVVPDPIAEHEIGRGQHRGGDGDDGFLWPAAVLHAQELRLEIAPLLAGRGPRGLDEGGLEPGRGMADPGRAPLPGTFIKTRTEAGPGDQMARAGKPGHVDADFRDQHARGGVTHPRDRGQSLGGGTKGREGVTEVALQFPHGGVKGLNLGQMQLDQKAMMRGHMAMERGEQLGAAGLESACGGIGQPGRIGLARDQRLENRGVPECSNEPGTPFL